MVEEQMDGEPHAGAADIESEDVGAPAATRPQPPVTGDAAVDDAVSRLADLTAVPLADHPAVYEGVHRTLTDRLADVEG